ncbi:MAG: oligosaccharide flippase family protein [Gemmatimonadota bacterium]
MGFFHNFLSLAKWNALNILVVFAQRIVLARLLGPAALGAFGIALNASTILSRWLSFGVGPSTQYFASKSVLRERNVLGTSLALTLVVAVLGSSIAYVASPFLKSTVFAQQPDGWQIFWRFLPYLPAMQFAMVTAVFVLGRNLTAQYAVIQFVPNLLFLIVLLYAALFHGALQHAIAGQQVLWASAAVIGIVYAYAQESRARPDLAVGKDMVQYAMASWPVVFLRFGTARISVVLGALYVGAHDLGQYVVAVGLAEALLIGQGALSQLLLNRVSDAGSKADDLFLRLMRLLTGGLLVAWLVTALVGKPFFLLAYGPAFAPAWSLFTLLMGMSITRGLFQIQLSYLAGRGRPALGSLAQSTEFIVLLVLIPPIAATLGVTGLAIVTIIASMAGLIVATIIVQRQTGVRLADMFLPRSEDVLMLRDRFRKSVK